MTLKDKVGKRVLSSKNMQGVIIEIDRFIKVDYGDRTIQYQLDEPNAFVKGFLRFVDPELQKEVEEAIKESIIENARIEQENKIAEIKAEEERARSELLVQRKKYPNENLVYRSQICDGGGKDYSNWFKAPCSDELKKYHVAEDKHSTWCNKCSLCKEFVLGNATEQEVINGYNDDKLCYESKILLNHEIKAGWDTDKKGNPTRPRSWNLKDDHLVVLMTVEPGKDQREAIIYSVFLSDGTTQAENGIEASTCAAGDCFIDLTIEEARQMRLWDYMPAVKGDNPTFWGTGLFRYITDDIAARILSDVVDIVKKRNNKDVTAKAELFLKKFLYSFGGTLDTVPPKRGALTSIIHIV